MTAAALGLVAAVLAGCGSSSTLTVRIDPSADANAGQPFYVVVRSTEQAEYVTESYESVAARVFAKTGTIGHGNALSGYATTLRGARLLFSILGNNNNLHAQDANKVIDAICVAMVEELGPAPQPKKRK